MILSKYVALLIVFLLFSFCKSQSSSCFVILNIQLSLGQWWSSGSFDIQNKCSSNQLVNGLVIRATSNNYQLTTSSFSLSSVSGISFPAPVYWAQTSAQVTASNDDLLITLQTDNSGYLGPNNSATVSFGYNSNGNTPSSFNFSVEGNIIPPDNNKGNLNFIVNKPTGVNVNSLVISLLNATDRSVSATQNVNFDIQNTFNDVVAGNYLISSKSGYADAVQGNFYDKLDTPVIIESGKTSSYSINFNQNQNSLININLSVNGLLNNDQANLKITSSNDVYIFNDINSINNGIITLNLLPEIDIKITINAPLKYNLQQPINLNLPTNYIQTQPISINLTEQPITTGSGFVNGWPNYIAMGAVTDSNTSNNGGLDNRPIDSIFKYSGDGGNGDPGRIVFPIYTLNTITVANNLSTQFNKRVKPVMVIYTAEMSGGTSFKDFGYDQLVNNDLVYKGPMLPAMHFINLLLDVVTIQKSKTDNNQYPGSLVLNADLLGMVQQQNLYSNNGPLATLNIPVNESLKIAICFIIHDFGPTTYTLNNGSTVTIPNGTPLEQSVSLKNSPGVYSYWDIKTIWEDKAVNVWYPYCAANPDQGTIPAFDNNFKGWIKATNWLIKNYGPDVTFGWQENIWSVNSANWIHLLNSETDILNQISNSVINFLKDLEIHEGNYVPDFLVFDRYEMDDSAAYGSGYWYNSRDWDNYLTYVKQISTGLNNIPVMLWQIPGGHIQTQNEIVTNPNYQRASTAASYFFGQSELNSDLSNIADYLKNINLNSAAFNCGSSCNLKNYMLMNNYNWSINNNKLTLAKNSNIFSILWGGGQTQSVGRFPIDDNVWLSNKIKEYYSNPIILK